MSRTVSHSRDAVQEPEQESPKPEEIRHQLRTILASPAFHGSKRCQQFLEYVCEKSLSGGGASLKERLIAIEVFGRQPHSDLAEDTIVRVSAREVRKRLAQYYVTPDGAASGIRIELPSGSYAPEFRYANVHVEAPAQVHEDAAHPSKSTAKSPVKFLARFPRIWVLIASAVLLLGIAAMLVVPRLATAAHNADPFVRFWAPVFASPEPLLVTVANPIVYHPSARALRMSEDNLPATDIPTQRPLKVPPNKLDGSDLIPVFDQYVGFGDMIAATEVASMLARNSKNIRVRIADAVEFPDLRQTPTLLIGAITNRWTMQLQQSWRFQFRWKPDVRNYIIDASSPDKREWSISARDDGSAQEDYILLSRVRNSSFTGGMILLAAGLKQFGTEAGGRLLTDREQLDAILRQLPSGWESKNLQVVLHAKVIGNAPAQPNVVAWHVW